MQSSLAERVDQLSLLCVRGDVWLRLSVRDFQVVFSGCVFRLSFQEGENQLAVTLLTPDNRLSASASATLIPSTAAESIPPA